MSMLNRRSFLKCTGLVALPAIPTESSSPNDLEQIVAECKSLDILGRPRSWGLVREGLHPISPERVITGCDGWCSRDRIEEEALRATLTDPAKLHAACVGKPGHDHGPNRCKVCRYPLSVSLPAEKLDRIFRLMRVLTDYYRVPHLFSKWAKSCAHRESLGSTGFGRGFAMPHQFQNEGEVLLTNPPVDWWLILFPEGTNWNACDAEPVYGMIAHVFLNRHSEWPGLSLRVWALTEGIPFGMKAEDWKRIAKMNRVDAARAINSEIGLRVRDAHQYL